MGTCYRILNVLNYYSPYISGLSNFAREVAEDYARGGHLVTTLTGRHRRDLPQTETMEGVQVVRAEPLLFLHKGYLSVDLFWRYHHLVRDADLVILHTPMLESGPLLAMTPRWVRKVVVHHCDVVASRDFRPLDWLAVRAVRASCRAAAKRADVIAVTSLDFADGSETLAGMRGKFFEMHPLDAVNRASRPRDPGKGLRVGFLGRFVEEKGIDVLLRAIPMVARELPEVRFALAGDYQAVAGGSQFGRLQHLLEPVRNFVDLLGKLPDADVPGFYRSLDLFVLPSINSYESFGMVQVEAMKHGVPVIASDLRGVRLPVRLTGSGCVVPAGDSGALSRAIVGELTRPDRRDPAHVAARAWSVFSPERRTERLSALLDSVGLS